ncbi:hypothetical protein [Pseudovibrio denitrificans]|uniref:hypothetical protein n=1 Tax=Pseudovibrio denitrificans TaxID=258256 RepID=UPI00157B65A8|nr:hypothetical protein [Pseudovibrio denitrificans]
MIFKEKERMLAVNLHSSAYPQGECGKAQGFLSLLRLVVCATKMTARTKVATLPSAATWAGTLYQAGQSRSFHRMSEMK